MLLTEYPIRPTPRLGPSSAAFRRLLEHIGPREASFAAILRGFAHLAPRLAATIPARAAPPEPCWCNPWFPSFDAVTLYGLSAARRPRRYVEVGSGVSTMFARRAIRDLGLDTMIVSIDPQPRAEVDALCDEVIRRPPEDVGQAFWSGLSAEDMLFVDSSHHVFPGSDVAVFFADVLPDLPPGLLWGLHDIFLPWDYQPFWMDRGYSEQYMLLTHLLAGGADDIVLPLAWASEQPGLHGILEPLWQHEDLFAGIEPYRGVRTRGGAFWMRRTGRVRPDPIAPEEPQAGGSMGGPQGAQAFG